jgi:hypothetical protein
MNGRVVVFALIAFLPMACAWGDQMVLEAKDVQFLKVIEVNSSPAQVLRISGLAFHSSLAVDKVTANVDGNSLEVKVHLVPTRKGLTGNFTYEAAIPDSVDVVRFGNEKTVIWKRDNER